RLKLVQGRVHVSNYVELVVVDGIQVQLPDAGLTESCEEIDDAAWSSRVDRVLSQWGAPDAYEGDVDALTLSQIPRHGCWVGFRRVDGDHVTECAYCLCAARLRLADDDAAGSGTQSEQRVQHANRSAAKNQHRTPHCHFAP